MESYYWSILIVVICLVLQCIAFTITQISRHTLKSIFPKNANNVLGLYEEVDGAKCIKVRYKAHTNKVFDEIIKTINRYLLNNKGSADYAILKDITDRNSDAVESQIEATSAIPVYIGLCGTLIGIVLGVGVLGFRGGIDALFDTEAIEAVESLSDVAPEYRTEGTKVKTKDGGIYVYSVDSDGQWKLYEDKGAEGIKNLLQGVGIAMITTLIGVILTIIGALLSKQSSRLNEKQKNAFLSWLQAELLPKMSNDIGVVIFQMQQNLEKFNRTFSSNTRQLDEVLKGINASYADQARLLDAIDKLKVDEIATANIRVLQELKECTDQIGELKQFVDKTTDYVNKVDNLNGILSDHLDRTKLIENLGKFFREEVLQIEQRKQAIGKSVADIDANMQHAFTMLREHTNREYQQLGESLAEKHVDFLKAVEIQQEALNKKLEETSQLVDELKNLTSVKENMEQLTKEQKNQNARIEALVNTTVEQNERIAKLVDSVGTIAATASSQIMRLDRLQIAIENSSEKTVDVHVKSPVIKTKTPLWKIIVEILICLSALGLLGLSVYTIFFK